MITAAAPLALLGVSPAVAYNSTAICNEFSETLSCPGSQLTTTVHGTAGEPLLDTSILDIKCTSSLFKASLLGLGNPQSAHLEELTWTSCKTHGGTNCKVTTLLKGLFNILKLIPSFADVTSLGGTAVSVKCGESMDCLYAGETTLLAEGGPADLKANSWVFTTSGHGAGSFCPSSSTFLALYTSLNNLYVRS
jgi:hypothetical protein